MEKHFHGTKDQFELYALDRLADSEFIRLEEHLIVCATCRRSFEEIEGYVSGMREALMADAESGRDMLGWLRRPGVSMALGLIMLIGVMVVLSRKPVEMLPSATLDLPAPGGKATAPPTRELDVTVNDALRDSGPFRVEVINPAGQPVWSGLAALGPVGVDIKVQQRMTPGDYFLRIYSVGGEKLQEYGFHIGS